MRHRAQSRTRPQTESDRQRAEAYPARSANAVSGAARIRDDRHALRMLASVARAILEVVPHTEREHEQERRNRGEHVFCHSRPPVHRVHPSTFPIAAITKASGTNTLSLARSRT